MLPREVSPVLFCVGFHYCNPSGNSFWPNCTPESEAVQKAFPGVVPTLPDLNQVANIINRAQVEGQSLLLVHPVWLAAAWWNKIVSMGARHVELPRANLSLECTKKQRPGPTPWRMRATLLVPTHRGASTLKFVQICV